MAFDFARNEKFPTQYASNLTAVTVDVLEAGFIAAFIILVICFYISLPSTDKRQTLSRFLRVTTLLVIGLLLLLGNFGQEWETAHIISRTPYRAGSGVQINASIGVKIGLRSVNVTLKAPQVPAALKQERIDYNERFEWTWDQGRFGFGPYAGHLQQAFRAAQYRGLPTPILWVMDYFVIDGEGFRHGRFYRTAGWYCHVCMWCAFTCWLLSIILFRSVILYAAYCLGTCGILQLLANLLWLVVRNPNPLVIPFEDAVIRTKFGLSFWLTFATGIFCLFIATVAILIDSKFHTHLYTFFGLNPLNSYDEVAYLSKSEQLQLRKKTSFGLPAMEFEMEKVGSSKDEDEDNDEYLPVYIKRKTTVGPPVIRANKPKLKHM